jgi:hypothetical protein
MFFIRNPKLILNGHSKNCAQRSDYTEEFKKKDFSGLDGLKVLGIRFPKRLTLASNPLAKHGV